MPNFVALVKHAAMKLSAVWSVLFLAIILCIFSCSKPLADTPANNTTNTNTDTTGNNNHDSTTNNNNNNTVEDTSTVHCIIVQTYNGSSWDLNVYNPDLSVKWHHVLTGMTAATNIYRGNIYYCLQNAGTDSLVSASAETGLINWKKSITGIGDAGAINFYNDSVYVNTLTSTSNWLYVFSVASGNLYWQQQLNDYHYQTFFSDIKNGFATGVTVDNGTHYYAIGYDLSARNLLWSIPASNGGGVPKPLIAGNNVYVRSGEGLRCLDKISGAVLWSKGNYQFGNPVVDGNNVFAINNGDAKLYAMNAGDGTLLWPAVTHYLSANLFGNVYINNGKCFVFGEPLVNTSALNKIDIATGDTSYQKIYNEFYQYPIACGNKIFGKTLGSQNADPTEKIMVFNRNNGVKLDSIITTANPLYNNNFFGPWIITGSGEVRKRNL